MHDDQHGTAIITAAGFLNALQLTGRDITSVKIVANGAGAASIACALSKPWGFRMTTLLCVTGQARFTKAVPSR